MGIKDAYRIPDGNAISNFHRFPHTHRKDAVGGLPMTEGKLPNGHPFGGSNSDRSVTIVSKVSLAVALIIESALPDFSHFEFAKIQFLSHPCKFSFSRFRLQKYSPHAQLICAKVCTIHTSLQSFPLQNLLCYPEKAQQGLL